MSDIPAEFEPIRDELSAMQLDKLRRVKETEDWSREHHIPCTGRPEQIGPDVLECKNPPFVVIVLHGFAFAVPCTDCANPIVAAIMRAGHGSCRTDVLKTMDADLVRGFAEQRIKDNKAAGKFIIPEAKKEPPRMQGSSDPRI